MWGRILGGVLLGTVVAAVVYEIIDRENPELAERIKGWLAPEEELFEPEPEEVPAE